MSKFRKKPVVIDAWHFDGSWDSAMDLVMKNDGVMWTSLGIDGYVSIKTLEGTMKADPGDWIIRGVKGELYPCKPDIFEATYEPA
jgi:hypothetical protein